jgi:hypothetical protein
MQIDFPEMSDSAQQVVQECARGPESDYESQLKSYQATIQDLDRKVCELQRELQLSTAQLEATENDRQRLRARLLTTASQLESAVAEAREKDKDRRSIIKAYKHKFQMLEQVV